MLVKYNHGEFVEDGIKIYLDGDVSHEWIWKFKNAKVTDTLMDSSGDYLQLDLNRAIFVGSTFIQRMSLTDSERLREEFIKRVKTAIQIANIDVQQMQLDRKNKEEEQARKEAELKSKLAELNREKF